MGRTATKLCVMILVLLFAAGASLSASDQQSLPARLILYPNMKADPGDPSKQMLTAQVYSPDGKLQFSLPGFCEGAWSPQGNVLACNTRKSIIICDRTGRLHTIAEAADGSIFYWYPSWSPDGASFAIISVRFGETVGQNIWTLQIRNATSGQQVSAIDLPHHDETKIPLMGGFPFTMISPDKIAWSPDGKRILISWGFATLVDVQNGKTSLLSPNPVLADWDQRHDLLGNAGTTFNQPAPNCIQFYRAAAVALPTLAKCNNVGKGGILARSDRQEQAAALIYPCQMRGEIGKGGWQG